MSGCRPSSLSHPHAPIADSMTTTSWLIMFLITGIIWGGFIFLASIALRREAAKEEPEEP